MEKLLSQASVFGNIPAPVGVNRYSAGPAGFSNFINNIVKILIIVGGIYALINLILAGYAFISAGGDSKQVQAAWARIYQTLIGLAFTAGAFVIAAIFGQLLFGDPAALLQIRVFTPY